MKRAAFFPIFLVLAAGSASSDDVPFAAPPPSGSGEKQDLDLPGLGDVMSLVQMRHIKLWYAGRARNWKLAGHEIGQLEDALHKAAIRYENIPVSLVTDAWKPLGILREAVANTDLEKFESGYAGLTASCNACHQAGGVGFINIQTPTSLPFSDQKFEPR